MSSPAEEQELLRLGLGITNLVDRASATAAELTSAELRCGARQVEATGRAADACYRDSWLS